MDKWVYYNHAMIPATAPHEVVDISPIGTGDIWKNKHAVLARWTSDFDCKEETAFWYVIKDDVLDLAELKAKRRYEINKGMRYFEVRLIDPAEYIPDMYQVYQDALNGYPEEQRYLPPYDTFEKDMLDFSLHKDSQQIYAAFLRETNELCGYLHVPVHKEWAALSTMKTKPQYEKHAVNAALIYGVLEGLKERMDGHFYISDGARNILHDTKFQDYLEKYFNFRKAYCHLHIKYRPILRPFVYALYCLRHILKQFENVRIIRLINGVLKMEEFRRNDVC